MSLRQHNFDCAVDLGTSNLVLTTREGERFEMPSFVAVKNAQSSRTKIVAMGGAAKEFHGRTGEDVSVIRPVARGVVANLDLSSEMIKHAFEKLGLTSKKFFFSRGPKVLVSHPIELSPVEQKAFARACFDAGATKVSMIAEPLAAGAGVFEDHLSIDSKMVVDFGGGVIEAVAFSGQGIIAHSSMRWGSDDIDLDIEKYLAQMHHLRVGPLTSEKIKHLAAERVLNGNEDIWASGLDLITRRPKQVLITTKEIKKVLKKRADLLVQGIIQAFERIPETSFEEISAKGLVITGGGARLRGFLEGLDERIGMPVVYDNDPLHGVCRGEYKLMQSQPSLLIT